MSCEFFKKHSDKFGDLLGKLETASVNGVNNEEYLSVKVALEKEIEKSSKLLEEIAIE